MAVMDEIVSQRVEFSCASILSFCKFNFGEDFFHQFIGITSRCQACSKVFNVLLKHYFRRVCLQEPKSSFFNEAFFNACWVATVVVCVLKCFSRFVIFCARRESVLSRISLPYRLLCPRKLFLTVRLQR